MGDSRRNIIFADFIFRQFGKKPKTCLVIADGKGELALLLSKKYLTRVIEAKPRQTKTRKRVKYTKGWFSYDDPIIEDIIVGMHPDEATAEIVKAARKNHKKWAIVPCCLKGLEAHGVQNFTDWIKKLTMLGGGAGSVRQTRLKFSGKNTVLWGQ